MSEAVRSPPAAARVALELLETLRTLSADGRALVAVRAAVDRLRVLAVQLLASGWTESSAEDGKRASIVAGEHAIAALVSDAVERLDSLANGDGRESVETVVTVFVLAFDLHRRVDTLEIQLFDENQASGDVKRRPEWLGAWQSDCRELLVERMRTWTGGDINNNNVAAQPKVAALRTEDDTVGVRDALVEVVERAVNELDSSTRRESLRTRLVSVARSIPLPTTRSHRHQRDRHRHSEQHDDRSARRATERSDRLGVIPPHELVDELGDSALAAQQSRVRCGEWLGTRVSLIPSIDESATSDGFRARVCGLFHLNHPNVLQVLGGCERAIPGDAKTSRVFVCEPVADGSLVEFLAQQAGRRRPPSGSTPSRQDANAVRGDNKEEKKEENEEEEEEESDSEEEESDSEEEEGETPRFVWRALLQAALALKFLHHRGIARGNVTCAQILFGGDGAARLAAFAELAPRESSWWGAPERLDAAGRERVTIESDIFSFGMCVVEAVARWQHHAAQQEEPEREEDAACIRRGLDCEIVLPLREQNGLELPRRPRGGFSDAQWELVMAMCCADPAQRMEMASVVHQIERFLQHKHDCATDSGLDLQRAPTTRPYLIAESLDELQSLVELTDVHDEDGRKMTAHVLHRLLDVHARLDAWAASATQNMSRKRSLFQVCGMTADAMNNAALERAETSARVDGELKQAIASFRATLDRFYTQVEAASRAASAPTYDADNDKMLVLMCASRTIGADKHYSFHVAIDQLMRRHLIARSDGNVSAIHDWKPQWNQQRGRQVERAKRRLQTLLLRSQHHKAGEQTVITACQAHGPSPPTATDAKSLAEQATNALTAPLDTPDWFTPPHEVLFDPRRPFSEGSFGSAHLGSWLDACVVIKKIKSTASIEQQDGEAGEEDAVFRREVGIWYALRHPHVVSLFGACYTSNERFFVCEYATQGELSDYLTAVGAREGEAVRVMTAWEKLLEAALGLQYLHARGVLHQDLKCDNILVGSDGHAKLTDFGLSAKLSDFGPSARLRDFVLSAKLRDFVLSARLRDLGLSARVLNNHNQTQNKAEKNVGAPRWKAPEVLDQKAPTMESDIFSLGMCVVEAVSGQFPWGTSLPHAAVTFHVKRGRLPPVDKARFSTGEWALVQEMCRKDPASRLPLESVVRALDAIVRKHKAARQWA